MTTMLRVGSPYAHFPYWGKDVPNRQKEAVMCLSKNTDIS